MLHPRPGAILSHVLSPIGERGAEGGVTGEVPHETASEIITLICTPR